MLNTEVSIFMIITNGEFIIGVLGNGFIGLVTFSDWVKKKKLSSIDYILTSLAFSRICLICIIVLNFNMNIFYPDSLIPDQASIVNDTFWTFSNHSSSWFGTCLSVFYLLKIANFSHPLFLWLKWRIDRVIVHLLLGCLAISFLIFLTLVMIMIDYYRFHVIAEPKNNLTELSYVNRNRPNNVLTQFTLLGIVPFTVSLISLFLLMLSLRRHCKQMKHSATGYRDPSTEAHVGAMKTVASFLFLLSIYNLSALLMGFFHRVTDQKQALLFAETIAILYPSGHSLILILGSKKLRQASARMLICKKTTCLV
ncbi:PREDICTED: taste receptor type 2 member 8-like [Chrysochloris asiatica]|uniref:Taste receptor type 2 n=1 Tax=Chrysochloris asiatica TaxID=185453 RepID=A0A9B0TJQ7_CHRAS|nr:PREDICTED: taste receptor type 2 member 8-like [Chrysochloris asiatica]